MIKVKLSCNLLSEKTLMSSIEVLFLTKRLDTNFYSLSRQDPNLISNLDCSLTSTRPSASTFIEKETLAQVFFYEFLEILKNIFFVEQLWMTAS